MEEKKICTCTENQEVFCKVHSDMPVTIPEEHDFKKYGFEFLDGEQIIMLVLRKILSNTAYGCPPLPNPDNELIAELWKRASKQRMHIPIFEREKKCLKKN